MAGVSHPSRPAGADNPACHPETQVCYREKHMGAGVGRSGRLRPGPGSQG